MREIPAEITCHPKLHTITAGSAEAPFVIVKGPVEPAKIFHGRTVTCVGAGSSLFGAIEIAGARVRTTTSSDDSGIECPIRFTALGLPRWHIACAEKPKL